LAIRSADPLAEASDPMRDGQMLHKLRFRWAVWALPRRGGLSDFVSAVDVAALPLALPIHLRVADFRREEDVAGDERAAAPRDLLAVGID